jgi:hypothetical protein
VVAGAPVVSRQGCENHATFQNPASVATRRCRATTRPDRQRSITLLAFPLPSALLAGCDAHYQAPRIYY